jgi:preprotein translocase subunit SecG
MTTFIISFILVACVLVVLVILAQNSKGGGLSAGAAGAGQIMGAKRAVDFLEKLTWGLGGVIIVLALLANILRPQFSDELDELSNSGAAPISAPATTPNKDSAAQAPVVNTPTDTTKK